MLINNSYFAPPLSNLTLSNPSEDIELAKVELRECEMLGFFVENKLFDSKLISYDKNYQNSVANSPTFFNHMKNVASILGEMYDSNTSILEIGCGKGDFFNILASEGFSKIEGYDTAYEGDDSRIFKRYLDVGDKKNADLIVLRHTLEHIPRPFDFLTMLKRINQKGCDIYIEVPNYEWILKNSELNEISFEHVNYFTINSLSRIFSHNIKKSGLIFEDQYLYIIANIDNLSSDYNSIYDNKLSWIDLDIKELFGKYFDRIRNLSQLSNQHERIYLWGGAARATLFLHICKYNFTALFNKIKFVVDINPKRFGKYLPSSHTKIISPSEFYSTAQKDDLVIAANPNYQSEIEECLLENLKFKIPVISLAN